SPARIKGGWVLAPRPRVAVHVEQAQVVGTLLTHRPGTLAAVRLIPGVTPEQLRRRAVRPAARRLGPAGVFPFRLREQAVARSPQVVGIRLHPFLDCLWVAPLLPRNAFLLAQPVTVL